MTVSRGATAFDGGLSVRAIAEPLSLAYGQGTIGPHPELRRLDAIRPSLRDPQCDGPDPVYAIAMDVYRSEHEKVLRQRMLLYGVVAYAPGRLGKEPVRSQGHIHAVAAHCGWSTPEIFEIWQGKAIVYAQERATDDAGRCIAVEVGPGDLVVVPPNWAHCVVNADVDSIMVFGAWCDRQYAFVYDEVRAHGGLAWFPEIFEDGRIEWMPNPRYAPSHLRIHGAREYPELDLLPSVPIYEQFANDPERVQWVSDPARFSNLWPTFEP